MKRIFLIILYLNLFYQQNAIKIQHSIGPSFLSTINTRQKIYYNNLGIRIDCLAKGDPLPIINWYRKINVNDHLLIPVHQSSQLIDLFHNGSLFIRPFQEYIKSIHAGLFICQAMNPAGSIQSLPIQLKPQINDAYEIEVKNPYGFIESSVIIICEISPPIAKSYLKIIGWLEQIDNKIIQLDLKIKSKYNILNNQYLIIHNLTKFDNHRSYACIIQNQIDNQIKQSQFKMLHVRDRSPFGPELSILNNTEYNGKSGDMIELPCGIASLSSNAKVSWWKNGFEMININEKLYENSLIFQISSSSTDDMGIYMCQIDDESNGRMISMMTLTITIPIECQLTISETIISAGSNSELICSTNMQLNSSIEWQWYHNSRPLFNHINQYSIINATRKHMGMYQCCFIPMISYLNGCCAQTQIQIINSPPFILSSNQQQIIISSKNHSHDFNLTIYADPIPKINIYKNGQELSVKKSLEYLPTGDIYLYYSILISNINDTGHYECLVMNSFGSVSIFQDISLEYQQPFIHQLNNQTIHSNEQFTIRCYASGQPNLYLEWIDQTTNEIINSSLISPILFTSKIIQSNIYICRARNRYGEISSMIYLTIKNPLRILYLTSNQTIEIHKQINISCSIDGDENFEVIFKTPREIKQYKNQKNILIIINQIEMIDNGLYECYVKNSYTEQRMISQILVKSQPNKIEKIFLDKTQRIIWIQPFDGNSPILRYILRIYFKHSLSWSNEIIINIEEKNLTNYSFENIFSKCFISVTIQAVNQIGISIPSDPVYFQINNKKLPIAPYNLTAKNISSKSVVFTWQYPSMDICNQSMIKFRIVLIDEYNQTIIRFHQSNIITINQLKSFTTYTLIIYAINDYGSSMKSKSLTIQTMEDVPLVTINDLTVHLINNSFLFINWTFSNDRPSLLRGQFRIFMVSIYENYNMSTLRIIETIHRNIILNELHQFSQYFITVSICNYFECGPSSNVIDIQTSSLIMSNRNLYDDGIHNRLMTIIRPTSIQVNIHYLTMNEIGLKINYPFEIIENLIIDYQILNSSLKYQLNISPPLFHIRLMNLTCGNLYDIRIYATNHIGSSTIEYLQIKTDGSIPIFIESIDVFETIGDDYIILNINQWLIETCPILFYQIEYYPQENFSEIEINEYMSSIDIIRIDKLRSNTVYQLNIKVISEAGENFRGISFRTTDSHGLIIRRNQQIIFICICISSFLITFLVVFLILKKIDLFNHHTKRLKPIVFSNKYSKTRSNSFTSEDSQGNINPYAVTNYEHYQAGIRPISTRYFRPVNIQNQSSLINNFSQISSSIDFNVDLQNNSKTKRQCSLV